MAYKFRSGLQPGRKSHEKLLIGPGVAYEGFDLSSFDVKDESTWGRCLGPTSGGNKIDVTYEWHNATVDGVLGNVSGFSWLVGAAAAVETSLLEWSVENLQKKLPNFNLTTHNSQYDLLAHDGSIAPVILENVAIVGELVGKNLPVIFVLEQARVVDAFEAALSTGKDDVVLKLKLEAEYTEDAPTKIPFYILYPKGNSPVTTPTATLAPGTYTGTQQVNLVAQSGAELYYTTDGSIPTPATATLYSGPITVSVTTTIKVIAVAGADVSTVANLQYIIN